MLCEVRLLRVALPAVLADVRLEVLGLLLVAVAIAFAVLISHYLSCSHNVVLRKELYNLFSPHLVLWYVLQQRGLVHEALVAGVALVGLVRLVRPGVGLEVAELREGLGAPGRPALVRLVPRVGADVLLEVGQLSELALADLAPGSRNKYFVIVCGKGVSHI